MARSYDLPYRHIVTIANFSFLGVLWRRKTLTHNLFEREFDDEDAKYGRRRFVPPRNIHLQDHNKENNGEAEDEGGIQQTDGDAVR